MLTRLQVVVVDCDVSIPVRAVLLVFESESVHHLMKDRSVHEAVSVHHVYLRIEKVFIAEKYNETNML